MRLLVQVGALSAAASAVLGDFSSLVAAAPALMGQMAYSRELEREADDTAIAVLQANRIPPAMMVALFEQLSAAKHPKPESQGSDEAPGISFSSHPSEAERIERFKNAPLSPSRLADEP
jgi:predicted Zn-dependent protease